MKDIRQKTSNPKERKRGGRPRKSEAERRSVQQGTKLSLAESEYVRHLSQTLNLTPCDLTRRALLEIKLPRPIPEINHQAWIELRTLAAELRRLLNRIKLGEDVAIDGELIKRFFEAVQALRLELRGLKS